MIYKIPLTSVLTQVCIWLLGILSKAKPRVRNKHESFSKKLLLCQKIKMVVEDEGKLFS